MRACLLVEAVELDLIDCGTRPVVDLDNTRTANSASVIRSDAVLDGHVLSRNLKSASIVLAAYDLQEVLILIVRVVAPRFVVRVPPGSCERSGPVFDGPGQAQASRFCHTLFLHSGVAAALWA